MEIPEILNNDDVDKILLQVYLCWYFIIKDSD